MTVEQVEEARRVIEVVSVQNRYNLTDREHDAVLDYCTREGIAFIPWLPIASGGHASSSLLWEIAAEVGATSAQVSLAWLLHRSPVVVPIPGTKPEAHLKENEDAAQLRLPDEQLARLESVAEDA